MAAALILSGASVARAAPETPLLSISEINARHENLDQAAVRVRGWITACQPLGCSLDELPDGKGAAISIGSSKEFDRSVLAHDGRIIVFDSPGHSSVNFTNGHLLFVEIEGVINSKCFDHSHERYRRGRRIALCIDRTGQLLKPRLMHVLANRPTTLGKAN